jgi:zinc/manganese transport system substrate-binding protein
VTRIRVILLFVIALMGAHPAQAEPVKIVTSFSVLGDLARQVGGQYVAVTALVGPDGDVHTYQPTPADAKNIARADLVIINGLGLEGWIDRLIEVSGFKGNIVTASRDIPRVLMTSDQSAIDPTTDPHAWQNLKNGGIYVKNIAAALASTDSTHAAFYFERATILRQNLDTLDQWVHQQIDNVPYTKRSIISSHSAFGYFADAYGIQVIAPVGLSTESEPSAKDLKTLVDIIRSGKTRALFIENMADPKLINQLTQETGVRLGGKLYADALSSADGPAATYQQMFTYNVSQLVAAMKNNR